MFAEVKNGAVVTFPYDYDTLVKKNPYTNFNQTDFLEMYSGTKDNLDGNELVRVTEANPPVFDKQTQKLVKDSMPTLIGNAWTLGWSVQTLNQTEQIANNTEQAKSVRQARDQKLKNSDWTQVADSPVNKEDWAAYRQALRNLPNVEGFPWTVTFPSEPA